MVCAAYNAIIGSRGERWFRVTITARARTFKSRKKVCAISGHGILQTTLKKNPQP